MSTDEGRVPAVACDGLLRLRALLLGMAEARLGKLGLVASRSRT